MSSTVLKKWLQKPLALAVLLNVLPLLMSFMLGSSKYHSLDDHFMQAVLVGAYGGKFDSHLYFINAAYAYFLWPFYKLVPTFGWYTFFQTISVFISFVTICYVILKKCGLKIGIAISVLVLVCVSTDFYFNVAFTQCASVMMSSGILLLAYGDSSRDEPLKKRLFLLVVSVLFILGGFVFRSQMFLLGLPTLGTVLLWNLFKRKSLFKPTLIALLCVAAGYFGLKTFNASLYKDNNYSYYARYQPIRSQFGDGAFYDRDAIEDEMDENGMDSWNFRYLKSWYFYDKNVFSIDSLKRFKSVVDRNLYSPNYAKMPLALLRTASNNVLTGRLWCWCMLCIILVFFQKGKSGFIPWVSLGVMSLSYTYLLLVNRVVNHVEVGIWLMAVVCLLNEINGKWNDFSRKCVNLLQMQYLLSIAGVMLLCTHFAFNLEEQKPGQVYEKNPKWKEFFDYAQTHTNDVFLLPFDRYKGLATFVGRPFVATAPGSWNNVVSMGYWNIHFPSMENELLKRGVTNPIRDIVNGNVYVIEDAMMLTLKPFYQKHYHKKLSIDTVTSFGDMNLLKYSLQKDEVENEIP